MVELLGPLALVLTGGVLSFQAGHYYLAAVASAGFVMGVMAALLPYIPAQTLLKLPRLPRLPGNEALELLGPLALVLTGGVLSFQAGHYYLAAVAFASFVMGVMAAVLVAGRD